MPESGEEPLASVSQDESEAWRSTSQIERRGQLYSKITALATRYNRLRNGVPAMAAIAAILQDPCEKKIEHDLANPPSWDARFDPIFKELHSYAVSRVLDHLRTRLSSQEGLRVAVSSEAAVPLGHYDILLQSGTPCRLLAKGTRYSELTEILRVEVKTAQSLPISEATRYIWASDAPLLIARFLTGQIAVLRPEKLGDYVRFTMEETIQKAERILAKDIQATPGPYCVSCNLSECEWNDNKHRLKQDRIVTIRSFESDFTAVLGNIAPLCRKIGDIAVAEMRSMRRLETP